MGFSCATVNSVSCSVTLLPPSLYIATWRMISECIFCDRVLDLFCVFGLLFFCQMTLVPISVGPSRPTPPPPLWGLRLLLGLSCPHSSYCSISPGTSVNSWSSHGWSDPSSPSARPFGGLEKIEAGSVLQGLQIGTCTDCLQTWAWSFCITQSTAWQNRLWADSRPTCRSLILH